MSGLVKTPVELMYLFPEKYVFTKYYVCPSFYVAHLRFQERKGPESTFLENSPRQSMYIASRGANLFPGGT